MFIGISFLATWLVGSWRRVPHGEYLLIPLILIVIATVGFIEGFLIGLLAALVQFVLKYSRTPVIRYALSGANARSAVERSIDAERFLDEHGAGILLLKLRGYLFFGTTAQLSTRIRQRLDEDGVTPLRFVLLDFRAVNGIDSSANYEFHRLRLMAQQQGFTILFTGMSDPVADSIDANASPGSEHSTRRFTDLDHGLEWCEEQLLADFAGHHGCQSCGALALLEKTLDDDDALRRFETYLERVAFSPGDRLITQGDAPGDLFFLEEGHVSVYLEKSASKRVRIRRTGPGTVLGELGFYLRAPRTASVIAEDSGLAFRLSSESLARMQVEAPELAAAFHRFMADLLAERLVRTTRTLDAATG
jgi:SulP family sulfate permease